MRSSWRMRRVRQRRKLRETRRPHYFFFAAFLADFFAAFFGAAAAFVAFFLAAFGAVDEVLFFFPPKTWSQFFQNSGVVPVRTIGPLMLWFLLNLQLVNNPLERWQANIAPPSSGRTMPQEPFCCQTPRQVAPLWARTLRLTRPHCHKRSGHQIFGSHTRGLVR